MVGGNRTLSKAGLRLGALTVRAGLIGHGLGGRAFHEPLIRAAARLSLEAIATTRSSPDPAIRSTAKW